MTNERASEAEAFAGGEFELLEKERLLFARLHSLESTVVAFSGGADSAYLSWAANQVLGERMVAITALSPSFSVYDRQQVAQFVTTTKVPHEFVETREMENGSYVVNNADRCYHCKTELFDKLRRIQAGRGFAAIAYGANVDDLCDFRPGHRAAFENDVMAPLLETGLTKSNIRELSKRAGLSTWDRPSSPCLSSRIPYGIQVTLESLSRVERAESAVREFGFRQFRVRFHGDTARIEIGPEELSYALQPEVAPALVERVRRVGFATVILDPKGYRQGSLNGARPSE